MRCPKCHTETPSDAMICPGCKLPTPRGRHVQAAKLEKEERKRKIASFFASLRRRRQSSKHSKLFKMIGYAITVIMSVGIIGAGAYVYFGIESNPVDAAKALELLTVLRASPSTQDGVSVDERMTRLIKESEKSGRLVRYEGWTTRRFGNSKQKILISFTFEETETGEQRAEWLADMTSKTFIPQTPLATEVFKGE